MKSRSSLRQMLIIILGLLAGLNPHEILAENYGRSVALQQSI